MDFDPSPLAQRGHQVRTKHAMLSTPTSAYVSHAAGLSRHGLRCWSRWIRDVLIPAVKEKGGDTLSPTSLANLKVFFNDLEKTTIDLDQLRFSRIHNALSEVCVLKSNWPEGIVKKALAVLVSFEQRLGPLKDVRTDLWAVGGRLEGIVRLGGWAEAENSGQETFQKELTMKSLVISKSSESYYVVSGGMGPLKAFNVGHNEFEVGAWWIEPAAAYRDGMIHNSPHGITADAFGAYAILMTDDEEVTTGEDIIQYRATLTDPGRFKLMGNVISRQPVRVFRSWLLVSKWKPKAGVRYDGLYHVSGHGVRLVVNSLGKDEWQYTYNLRRKSNQPSLHRALTHPTADELDDWKDYQRIKSKDRGNDVMSLLFGDIPHSTWSSKTDEISLEWTEGSRDSGYFSRRQSEQLRRGFFDNRG